MCGVCVDGNMGFLFPPPGSRPALTKPLEVIEMVITSAYMDVPPAIWYNLASVVFATMFVFFGALEKQERTHHYHHDWSSVNVVES